MNGKFSKRMISLVLIVTMMLSALSASTLCTSALIGENFEYKIEVSTPGSDAKSNDIMVVKIYGTKGYLKEHMFTLGSKIGTATYTFKDYNDIGDIKYMTIENKNGIDGWYFNWIKLTTPSDSETFYGGRWLDNSNVVTFRPDDNVVKLEIQTGSETYAGTDADIHFRLIDTDGDEFLSDEASSVHIRANAFEKNDFSYMYVYIDSKDFGQIDDVVPELHSSGTLFSDWYLDYIKATHVSGKYTGEYKYIIFSKWIEAQ